RLAGAGLFDTIHVLLRRSIVRPPPPAAAGAPESARAATSRRVLAAAPVERIVHRLETGSRVVGDLVARIAAARELDAHRLAHSRRSFVVGQLQLPAPHGLA